MASLTPEPAQHFSALLGRGYDGEGDCALNALPPSFPAATTTPTTATTETTLGLETKATTKTLPRLHEYGGEMRRVPDQSTARICLVRVQAISSLWFISMCTLISMSLFLSLSGLVESALVLHLHV